MTEFQYTDWNDVPLSLTIQEAADLLRVHHNTVRNQIKSGQLPAMKLGKEWRISKDAVRASLGIPSALSVTSDDRRYDISRAIAILELVAEWKVLTPETAQKLAQQVLDQIKSREVAS